MQIELSVDEAMAVAAACSGMVMNMKHRGGHKDMIALADTYERIITGFVENGEAEYHAAAILIERVQRIARPTPSKEAP